MDKKNSISIYLASLIIGTSLIFGCGKKDTGIDNSQTFAQMQKQTLQDFVNVVAKPTYADFKVRATALNNSIITLVATPNVDNQTKARDAWRDVRVVWEQSEGFLIGPVEDDNYDPYMDTWPTDHEQMNTLLAGSQELTVAYLESETSDAQLTLRGFHPLEYMLWGTDGKKDPTTYTDREKKYMTALAQDILNNVTRLNDSWIKDNFGNEITNPGQSDSRYSSQKDALKAIAGALIDICGEVGESKMVDPFDPQPDSTVTESPYSHNSIIDFKNNITGAYNVYRCSFGGNQGTSLSDLVAVNNKTLDAQIKQKFQAVLNSFDGITTTFEQAVYSQRSQVQTVLDAIASLKETLDGALVPYFEQYIKD